MGSHAELSGPWDREKDECLWDQRWLKRIVSKENSEHYSDGDLNHKYANLV